MDTPATPAATSVVTGAALAVAGRGFVQLFVWLMCACVMVEGLWVPRQGVYGFASAAWVGLTFDSPEQTCEQTYEGHADVRSPMSLVHCY